MTLRAVAVEVGVTPMAIYRHFRDKDALVEALVQAGFARWETRLARAARKRKPLAQIEGALLAYAEFALDEPNTFELMFLVRRANVPEAPRSLAMSPSPSFSRLIDAVRMAMEQGALARDDPTEVILLAWATAHGLIALHFSGRFGWNNRKFRQLHARVIRRLLRGLAPGVVRD